MRLATMRRNLPASGKNMSRRKSYKVTMSSKRMAGPNITDIPQIFRNLTIYRPNVTIPRPIAPAVSGAAPSAAVPAESGGLFGALGNMGNAIMPWLPLILGLAFFGILIFILYKFLNKGGKAFSKDYDREAFKDKVRYLSRDSPRTSSKTWFFIPLVVIIVMVLTAMVMALLYFLKVMTSISFTIPAVVAVFSFLIAWLITAIFPAVFTSYPCVVNKNLEMIGWLLSVPKRSSDGYLDMLIFKKSRWLIFKDVEVFSIPLMKSYSYKVRNSKEKRTVTNTVECDLEESERWMWLGTGDIKVNCADLTPTRFFIYPVYRKETTQDIYDFTDVIFVREKAMADRISMTDVANISRENAVVLAGGNPYMRLSPEGKNSENE